MNYYMHKVSEGTVMVLSNEAHTKWDEYSVASAFKHYGTLYFAQMVGTSSPKPYLGADYKVNRERLDGKNNLYTIYYKEALRYSFPAKGRRIVIAPTKEAAWSIWEKLLGIGKDKIRIIFECTTIQDEVPTSKRIAIIIKDRNKTVEKIINGKKQVVNVFDDTERKPTYYKGGEVGNIA